MGAEIKWDVVGDAVARAVQQQLLSGAARAARLAASLLEQASARQREINDELQSDVSKLLESARGSVVIARRLERSIRNGPTYEA